MYCIVPCNADSGPEMFVSFYVQLRFFVSQVKLGIFQLLIMHITGLDSNISQFVTSYFSLRTFVLKHYLFC